MRVRFLAAILLLTSICSGCTKVEPWEKEALSKSIMAFDPDPLETRTRQHIFFSKEGSSGGYGLAGGGCGCN
jgi:hypothetical protein